MEPSTPFRLAAFAFPAGHNIPAVKPLVLQASVKCVGTGCRAFLRVDADRVSGPDRAPRLCDACLADLEADLADLVVAAEALPVVEKPTEVGAEPPAWEPPALDSDEDDDLDAVAMRRPLFETTAPTLADPDLELVEAGTHCGFCVDVAVDVCDHEGCGKPLCAGCASDDHRCPDHA